MQVTIKNGQRQIKLTKQERKALENASELCGELSQQFTDQTAEAASTAAGKLDAILAALDNGQPLTAK